MNINTARRDQYGPLDVDWATGTGHTAPPVTTISVDQIANNPQISGDEHGIRICGQVWYTPIDLHATGMALICRKTRDQRPLAAQIHDRRTTRVGREM